MIKMLNFFLHRLPCHQCCAPLLVSNRHQHPAAGELTVLLFFCPCYKSPVLRSSEADSSRSLTSVSLYIILTSREAGQQWVSVCIESRGQGVNELCDSLQTPNPSSALPSYFNCLHLWLPCGGHTPHWDWKSDAELQSALTSDLSRVFSNTLASCLSANSSTRPP